MGRDSENREMQNIRMRIMSIIPVFELGLWNAWILMLYLALHPFLMGLIDKDMMKKMGGSDQPNKDDKGPLNSMMLVFLLLIIYSVFLPLKLGTIWFYAGLPIYLVGMAMFTIAVKNIASTPLGQPFTKGIYCYSRNPMNLASFLMLIGTGIATASWFFLVLSAVLIVLIAALVRTEESYCLERYGKGFREYMERTPRWIGMPKSGKN